jgi:hypothetical protein
MFLCDEKNSRSIPASNIYLDFCQPMAIRVAPPRSSLDLRTMLIINVITLQVCPEGSAMYMWTPGSTFLAVSAIEAFDRRKPISEPDGPSSALTTAAPVAFADVEFNVNVGLNNTAFDEFELNGANFNIVEFSAVAFSGVAFSAVALVPVAFRAVALNAVPFNLVAFNAVALNTIAFEAADVEFSSLNGVEAGLGYKVAAVDTGPFNPVELDAVAFNPVEFSNAVSNAASESPKLGAKKNIVRDSSQLASQTKSTITGMAARRRLPRFILR